METPSELVLIPAFPGSQVLQLDLELDTVPKADFKAGDRGSFTTLRPGLRLRAAAPLTDRLTAQVVARYGATLHEFEEPQSFFGAARPATRDPWSDLHDARLSLQSSFAIAEDTSLLFDQERWSLLGELFGGARWERGAFGGGLLGGGGMGLAYEIRDRFELVVGFALRTRIGEGGVGIDPIVSARWQVTDALALRSRGRGGQVEYQWNRSFMTYATGFESGSTWRLDRRSGVPTGSLLSDEQLRVGLGLRWRLHRQLRLQIELGSVVRREIEVDAPDEPRISTQETDPSAYLMVSIDLRP